MNISQDEEAITLDEAKSFIADYCDWNPLPDEHAAARRLVEAGITGEDLDRMHYPGNAALQDRIDAILYST